MEEFKNTINGTDQMQSIQTNPVQGQQAMQNPNPMQGQQAMQNPNPVQGNPAMTQMNYQQAVNVYNQNPADYYRKQREEKRRWDKIEGNLAFQRIGIPSLIYAVIYAFCWYKNSAGILNLIFTVFLAGYILLVVNRNKLELKKLTVFFQSVFIFLSEKRISLNICRTSAVDADIDSASSFIWLYNNLESRSLIIKHI